MLDAKYKVMADSMSLSAFKDFNDYYVSKIKDVFKSRHDSLLCEGFLTLDVGLTEDVWVELLDYMLNAEVHNVSGLYSVVSTLSTIVNADGGVVRMFHNPEVCVPLTIFGKNADKLVELLESCTDDKLLVTLVEEMLYEPVPDSKEEYLISTLSVACLIGSLRGEFHQHIALRYLARMLKKNTPDWESMEKYISSCSNKVISTLYERCLYNMNVSELPTEHLYMNWPRDLIVR